MPLKTTVVHRLFGGSRGIHAPENMPRTPGPLGPDQGNLKQIQLRTKLTNKD
jgi:hypothetical protein